MRLAVAPATRCRDATRSSSSCRPWRRCPPDLIFPISASRREGLAAVRQIQKLRPRARIVAEGSAHGACYGFRILLLDAAHHHAEVIRLDDHANAGWREHILDRASNLLGEPLLHLQPSREDLDDARQL